MPGHATARDVYRQALPVVLVSLVAGLFAGTILGTETMRSFIADVPGLLLLLPAFLATRGGVYGSLGARLSTGLHQGLIEPRFQLDRRLTNAIVASFINGMTVSVFIAVVTYLWLGLLGSDGSLLELVGIMVVAGLLSAVLMISVLITVIFVGYRRGLDPDNVIGPVVTTLGDVFGVLFLLVGVALVGAVI
ncbi:magnesium transporter [Halorubrum laminariae]|uniref:Magnesium transporter n=1 Tax=Halorubrum laminariae TaxID=1433523 RepID=A0ABD6C1J5_9EURY|nr:magnesium transporter [Halorubrum laminariae]